MLLYDRVAITILWSDLVRALLDIIKNDLKIRNIDNKLATLEDLHHLEILALDRKSWKNIEIA